MWLLFALVWLAAGIYALCAGNTPEDTILGVLCILGAYLNMILAKLDKE